MHVAVYYTPGIIHMYILIIIMHVAVYCTPGIIHMYILIIIMHVAVYCTHQHTPVIEVERESEIAVTPVSLVEISSSGEKIIEVILIIMVGMIFTLRPLT